MPLYPTSFFIPPTGVPFIVEDKYVRGGYRVAANVAERDAIAVAGRKQGMLVRCMDTDTIWELVGGTSNTAWREFDATKYIKLGAPLILSEDGTVVLDLGDMFTIDGNNKLSIDVTNLLGPTLAGFFSATESDDQKVLTYNHATQSFILKAVSSGGGTTYDAQNPIKITGSTISLDVQNLLTSSLVTYFSADAADDGKALIYDHATTSFVLKEVAASSVRATGSHAAGSTAAGATKDFTTEFGKAIMLMTLDLNVPDVTIECHSTASRTDANPYRFKSAAGKLSDDGISVLEDNSLQYNRRYAFLVNLEGTPTATNYWRIVNNSASAQNITVNMSYLKLE